MTKRPIMMLTAVLSLTASAQTMSLQQCVDYALAHNTTIEQRRLAEANQRIQADNARSQRLPSLSASLGQGWGFGRSTGRDGTTIDRTSSNTNFSVSTSVPLFTGFRIPNQIKAEEYSLRAATENLRLAQRNVGVQVATYYLNALYYRGLVEVQRRQLELDKAALAKAQVLCEAGRRPQSEVASAEAQVAMTEHSLTEAVGNETLARLDLMQMLCLDGDVRTFAIEDIALDRHVDTGTIDASSPADGHIDMGTIDTLSEPTALFDRAVAHYPSILAAQYNLEASHHQLKVARSGYLPSLSLNASYSNGYNYVYDMENMDFGRQLDLNGSEYVGLSLSIPIFDRFQTRHQMRQARLSIESQNTALIEARQQLGKEIQQAYWNARKSHDNHASAIKARQSTDLAYQYELERYDAGKGTAYDLQQARTRLEKAMNDELQAKYEYLMRCKILETYLAEEE